MTSSAFSWMSMSMERTRSSPFFASVICEVPPAMGVPVRPVSTIIWPSVPERTSL